MFAPEYTFVGGNLVVKAKSPVTGIVRTQIFGVTEEQFLAWKNGKLIQRAFPLLSADDREFIMTGITPDEWEATFKEEEDDNG